MDPGGRHSCQQRRFVKEQLDGLSRQPERSLLDMLALHRMREAAFFRYSDKVPKLMNYFVHRDQADRRRRRSKRRTPHTIRINTATARTANATRL
jgi:hypothetical protein